MIAENPRHSKQPAPRQLPVVTWSNLRDIVRDHDLREQPQSCSTTVYCSTCRSRLPGYLEAYRHAAALTDHVVHIETSSRTMIGTPSALLDDECMRREGWR
ncbi:hypothetical protein N864_07610 [Intrasporangium chromatireducens Q5-1]|uniref:Uncharacterized protein n=1 Tax=Intrasporangium chromatireducens Q5-1 TaxID=584657 RepID=W9GIU3_9MICO|nr:hypothetical protein [Intrasporangium chromatireducens]EWT05057.1 hypothetical protein N864_07610 [Intrasporangium chromatireducens Q5-1]